MEELVLVGALVVAFVNGANDNFKGVATLYGSGTLSYRGALTFGTVATALGGIASLVFAVALARAFSAKGLVPDAALSPAFLAAVALAAGSTVLLATRLGFPVSTTHSLVGGLVGAGWVVAGSELNVGVLGGAFALPLLAGPLIATGLAWLGLRLQRGVGREPTDGRRRSASGLRALTFGHVLSGGLASFGRGLNDTPKILGLLVGASVLSPALGVFAITCAMALGGLLAARRVAETLAHCITPMTPGQGLVANCVTALLVTGASPMGLPLSTTHVSAGGIFGIGVDSGSLRWRAVGGILSAWVTTLPLAAALGAGFMWGLR